MVDIGLFDISESMVKAHATLEQYWKQISNIEKKLRNSRIPEEKKRDLRKKEQEVRDKIHDLSAKILT